MCLITESKTPSISEYNISCYKILIPIGGEYITPYRDFPFSIGKVTTDLIDADPLELFDHYIIEEGYFHSYKNIKAAKHVLDELKRQLPKDRVPKIFEAQIPEGTPFFEGQFGDIGSKSLLVIKEYIDQLCC